jgi:hypothetical protein
MICRQVSIASSGGVPGWSIQYSDAPCKALRMIAAHASAVAGGSPARRR